MSASISEVASQICMALGISDPDLDTSVGTTTRKIVDAVAESIAEAYLDQHMLSYVYDVDSKNGADLDAFTQTVGGISRLAAKRATGTVTLTRSGAVDRTVFVPMNVQIASNTNPSVLVQTLSGASMMPGQLSVTVPVQAIVPGPDGNLGAETLTLLQTTIEGVTRVTNMQALTGGLDQETDAELRLRWKTTAFRSNAGTEPMYLGLALNDESVTAAQVIGASKRRREQVQISAGSATSTVTDCAYAFATNVYVGANIDSGVLLLKDNDYTWDTTVNPPRVVISPGVTTYDTGTVDGGGFIIRAPIEGAVLDLDFEYTPTMSRNDPTGSRWGSAVMSRVDVWCAGKRPVVAQQSVVFSSSKTLVSAPSSAPYYTGKFARLDGSPPVGGNVFIPLAFGPIIAIPDILTVGGVTYGRMGSGAAVTHPDTFAVVHQSDAFGYAPTSLFGLEWLVSTLPSLVNGTVFTLGGTGEYLYDEVPRAVQAQVDRWRLVGVDAKVHAAVTMALRVNLAIMYARGVNHSSVDEAASVALSIYFSQVGLGGVAQVSDIEQVVHNVPGVDNVRMLDSLDYPTWTYAARNAFNTGIQRVVAGVVVQTYIGTTGHPLDVVFGDAEYPVLESIFKAVKAQNTFQR